MRGDFDRARTLISRGRALFEELGIKTALVAVSEWAAEVEELAGNLLGAEKEVVAALNGSKTTGDKRQAQMLAFWIARLADLQGRHDEAEGLMPTYEETAASNDPWLRVARCCWRARTLARQGKIEKAVQLVREAVALAPPPDLVLDRCAVLMDAAEILSLAGHPDHAALIDRRRAALRAKGQRRFKR